MKISVLFFPLGAYGHINSCIGIAEKIIKLGHRVTFALESAWRNKLKAYGFHEVIYKDPSRDPTHGTGDYWVKAFRMLRGTLHKDPYKAQHQDVKAFEGFIFHELKYDDQLKAIIKKLKPNVIVVDHYVTIPSIYKSGIKWIYMTSATPLTALHHPDTPPTGSGYPTEGNRRQWETFIDTFDKFYRPVIRQFNQELVKLGLPNLPENSLFHHSPYLNIYAYPEELDYLDIRPLPDKWRRFDHFVRSSDLRGKKFHLPNKLKKLPGKLIYVSMGSMACHQLTLMQRLVNILRESPHRFLMMLGPNYGKIELPKNISAEVIFPQVDVLPMVEMVITHGGNNSVLESLYHGKPMIINPMFHDQYDNAQRLTEKGFGQRIDIHNCRTHEYLELIERILSDKDMKMRCERISLRMKESNSTIEAAKAIINIGLSK